MREPELDADRWQAALAYQRPLLALAERLLRDPDRAGDAVAHALLQESRGARAVRTPLWLFLCAVVRNFAWRVGRDEAVRRRHEAAAGRGEWAPAAVDLAAREQLRQRVAEAVLALDEPYRTTVALVYLEEVPVGGAAERLGIAEATVRVRLHRAREELRRRLDREFGSRGAWVLVLGWGKPPVAAPVGVLGVVVGGIVMKKVLAVAVVAGLLLGVGSFVLRNWSEPASPPIATQAQVVAANVVVPPQSVVPVREVAATEPIAPTPATPDVPSQHFHCIDEQGRPVVNAEVRLVCMPWGSGVPDRVARSDAEGNAVVPELPAARYAIRASEGYRHCVPDLDAPLLPAAPRELLLRELWIGGIVMPGTELIQASAGLLGFMSTDHSMAGPAAERDLVAKWRKKHPEAQFWAAVRNPRDPYREGLEVTAQWFGHQTHKCQVRMWPASQFQGPEVVDPATVPLRDWVSCRVVLVDAAGQPLPEVLQAHLQKGYADLRGGGQKHRSMMEHYTFHTGIAKIPVGDYELHLYKGLGVFVSAARCTVVRDTTELRIPVAIADRVVRFRLSGLPGAGYMLKIVHESGRTAQEMGRADGEHTLLLPPGPCLVTCGWIAPNGRQESREHAFTITDAVEQELTWDVLAPK